MVSSVRVAAVQCEEIVADVAKASAQAHDRVREAASAGAVLVCFPEGYLQGYTTDPEAIEACALGIDAPEITSLANGLPPELTIVFGFIEREGDRFFNSAAIVQNAAVVGCYRKRFLLNRDRAFSPGDTCSTFEVSGLRFGINICYDMNFEVAAQDVRTAGADLLVCCSNNMLPLQTAKRWKDRHNPIRGERCRETGLWLLSSDVTGARDGEIAWGPTALLTPKGEVAAQLPLNEPGLLIVDVPLSQQGA